MKYKVGDKFIIEIWNEVKPQGLYTIKGFNTLVFDDYGLDKLEQVQEHDGCDGRQYASKDTNAYPCYECKYNYMDRWTPRVKEIQVGDEVENNNIKLKGVVQSINDVHLRVLYGSGKHYTFTAWWVKENCTRTGKTYPELIKALEQLPKE